MPLVALVMVPMQVYQTIAGSVAHEASWLYFTTPSERGRIITAARDAIALYVLLPLVLALGLFYMWVYRHPGHALAHCLFLAMFAYISLQIVVLLRPQLPFSVPLLNNRQAPFPFGAMMLMMFIVMPLALVSQYFAFRAWTAMTATLGLLLLMSAGLNVATRRRIARRRFPPVLPS